ncbi:similar to Saccharomyces cerevisiae YKR051W Putative protein of unknown function [Maudiozyma saulgeensis]|uniref:Uncharacterized protein n=1 Tax=Maudiozyma saulgeensis TaxID=1789683 RepID=A0A1X7R245_9SACH|nr:similar to Saccharomyces cerevisiae YKR051W Putative protein of unknown function [Kazachstania saulgeensis]
MLVTEVRLPIWWELPCYVTCSLAIIISLYGILRQWVNYRRPFEQRLVVRILLLVPLFSIGCGVAIKWPNVSQVYLDPLREFYEAFVIYTFFSLLTLLLGGERHIITSLTIDHSPTKHALHWLGTLDLSDPGDFLSLKRGILQYVWFKPFYCFMLLVCETKKWDTVQFWLLILYNISVSWSLYNLAMFWKCLHKELSPFDPWSKFLCVKLIIFASYWQGLIIHTLGILGLFGTEPHLKGYLYENGILCIEMLAFAILHQQAFPWTPYSRMGIPSGARMKLLYAIKDCFGGGDLLWDFKQTLLIGHTYYNYRNFDTSSQILLNKKKNIRNTMNKLGEGYRYSSQNENSYWVSYGSIPRNQLDVASSVVTSKNSDEEWDTTLCEVPRQTLHEDPNYPVIWDPEGYRYTTNITKLKRDIESRGTSI